jgi:tripartite-type tricarboxylate transporter receptor subunit TctC
MTRSLVSRRAAVGTLAGLWLARPVLAQGYPAKPVRIVVSFAAGGGVDMMARLLGEQLGRQMGQTFVVENKPGASGTIGADAVAKSAPDGYTLLAGGNPELTFMQAVNDKLPYQPLRDLAPLMLVANAPSVLVVNAASPIQTMAQFMERARNAQGLPYATPGRGTPMHLAFELMNQLHGTKLIHVPYKGGGPATADVVGGQVECAVINAPPLMPHIRSGKLRALAVLQNERSPQLPDVPTLKEATGIADVQAPAWFALSMPAAVPADIRTRLETELRKALEQAEVRASLSKTGLDVVALPGARMGEVMAAEAAYNAATVKRLAYKPE